MTTLTIRNPALLAAAAGFNPLSIPGCRVWLDASDGNSVTSSSGSVSQWNDKSGNNIHFTQATAANQPTTGAVTRNNRNAISFDGSTDHLATSAWGSGLIATAFVVAWINTGGTYKTVVGAKKSGGYATSPVDAFYLQMGSPAITPTVAVSSGSDAVRAVAPVYANATWGIFQGIIDDTPGNRTVSVVVNDGIAYTVSNSEPAPGLTGEVAVGAGYYLGSIVDFWPGYIAEVILYTRLLTVVERTSVRNYLNLKWGVY